MANECADHIVILNDTISFIHLLNAGANIGTNAGEEGQCPQLGNNIFIGPGAKLFGKIYIADGCAIGANAVVTKYFLEPNMIIAGVPAKVIGKVERDLS